MTWLEGWENVIRDLTETAVLDAHRAAWAEGGELGRFVGLAQAPDGTVTAEWEVTR